MLQDRAPPLTEVEAISNIDGASVVTCLGRGENSVQQQRDGERERERERHKENERCKPEATKTSKEGEGIIGYRCRSSPVAGEEGHGDACYFLGAYVCLERLWNLQPWKFSKVSCARPRENITVFKVRLERCVGFDNLLQSQNKFSYHFCDSVEIEKKNTSQAN